MYNQFVIERKEIPPFFFTHHIEVQQIKNYALHKNAKETVDGKEEKGRNGIKDTLLTRKASPTGV